MLMDKSTLLSRCKKKLRGLEERKKDLDSGFEKFKKDTLGYYLTIVAITKKAKTYEEIEQYLAVQRPQKIQLPWNYDRVVETLRRNIAILEAMKDDEVIFDTDDLAPGRGVTQASFIKDLFDEGF